MAKQINLLPKTEVVSEERVALTLRVRLASLIVVIVVFLIEIGLFSYSLLLIEKTKKVGEEIAKVEETVSTYKDVESLAKIVKLRINALSVVFNNEFPYPVFLSDISSLMPSDMYLSQLNAQGDGKVTLTGVAKTSSDLGNFITNLTDPLKGAQFFTEASIGSIMGSPDGTYQFSLTMVYKKSK